MDTVKVKNILFVTHIQSQCGIYEFGKNIVESLERSKKYNFIKVECWSMVDLKNAIELHTPSAIIYNYHPTILPWVTHTYLPHGLHKNAIFSIKIPQIWIIHEVTQTVVEKAKKKKKYIFWFKRNFINQLFDYYIVPDPTLVLSQDFVFKTWRMIPEYTNQFPVPDVPTIGSFGFGTGNKWFEEIVKQVQSEFDEAIIRFNIPFAKYGDPLWENAKKIAENCRSILFKSKIRLEITHDFFSKQEMLDFLAKNTINVFLYQTPPGDARWISSVIENALAVKRPICISGSSMFRHIANASPSISIDDNSMEDIIQNWFAPLQQYYDQWKWDAITNEYERIISSVL
jgi:hypothetical protein